MKYIKFFLVLLAGMTLAVGCTTPANTPEDTTPVTVTISVDQLQMKVGDVQLLQATASNKAAITWESSDSEVASVMEGAVEAKRIGKAIITAKVEGGSATCHVFVTGKNNESLQLEPALVELKKGETYQYKCTSAYGNPVVWSSSNPDIISVDNNGLVTALHAGTVLISATDGLETVSSRVYVAHQWGEYQLVWEENFDGDALNTAVWTIEKGYGFGNNESQYYTDRTENLRVEDGQLVIEARKEEYDVKQYTSARIKTQGKKDFLYGKIEARICFPSGGGTWPAFWMLGATRRWPSCGEIDIIEHVGNNPQMLSFAIHTAEKNGTNGKNWSSRVYKDGVENQYHVYGVEWIQEDFEGRDRIIFSYDGEVQTMVLENEEHIDEDYFWPFNQPHYIILNLALGGTMGGTINDAIFDNPVKMKVDWVRVYQHNEQE